MAGSIDFHSRADPPEIALAAHTAVSNRQRVEQPPVEKAAAGGNNPTSTRGRPGSVFSPPPSFGAAVSPLAWIGGLETRPPSKRIPERVGHFCTCALFVGCSASSATRSSCIPGGHAQQQPRSTCMAREPRDDPRAPLFQPRGRKARRVSSSVAPPRAIACRLQAAAQAARLDLWGCKGGAPRQHALGAQCTCIADADPRTNHYDPNHPVTTQQAQGSHPIHHAALSQGSPPRGRPGRQRC